MKNIVFIFTILLLALALPAQNIFLSAETEKFTIFSAPVEVSETGFCVTQDTVLSCEATHSKYQCLYDATDSGFQGYWFESPKYYVDENGEQINPFAFHAMPLKQVINSHPVRLPDGLSIKQ